MRTRLAALAIAAAAALGGVAVAPAAEPTARAPVTTLKPCGSRWVHAALTWGHKCLGRGQFCKSYKDREYHRYGFHCHSGRLE